jgi:replicative DNA helicase
MKRLLRGVIDWGGISREGLITNYSKLRASKISWIQSSDRTIYKYVTDFFNNEQDVPSAKILIEFFSKIDHIETVERLKDIGAATAYEGANYSHVLKTVIEDARRTQLLAALKNAQTIATNGLVIGEGREKKKLEGVDEARNWLASELHDLELESQSGQTEANLPSPEDIQEGLLEYERAKVTTPMGVLTGLLPLDAVTRGLRKKQLWTHAAYTGGLKSTWALNWAVRAVTDHIRPVNVLFYSLEMSIEELRPAVFALYAGGAGRDLSVTEIATGKLDEDGEAYFRASLDHLKDGYYGHILLRANFGRCV